MATSALIALALPDGLFRWSRLHYGSPYDAALALLAYGSADQVSALLALGELSSVGALVAPPPGVAHSWSAPAPGVTVAYHRDRGEPLRASARGSGSALALYEAASASAARLYLFRAGSWSVDGVPLEELARCLFPAASVDRALAVRALFAGAEAA